MPPSQQFLLPLENRRPDRFEDFVTGPNGAAVDALRALVEHGIATEVGGTGSCIFLRGPEGSGKSHLLNASCNLAQGLGLQAFYMGLAELPEAAAEGLAGLESMDLVCLDDMDAIAGNRAWENAVFHCFNRLREKRRHLVISSTVPLPSLPLQLPDLASRLAWGLQLALEPLDDKGKESVLLQRAAAQGIELPADVVQYLMSRGSRNLAALIARLDAIRMAALAAKRRITVPLAREVLAGD